MDTQSLWQLADHEARLKAESLEAAFDLTRPTDGLHLLTARQQPLSSVSLFELHWQSPGSEGERIEDVYVRGADLIVHYAQTAERTVRPLVYWRYRLVDDGKLPAIEVILSMQTSLLDSQPRSQLISSLPFPDWQTESTRSELSATGETIEAPWLALRHRSIPLQLVLMTHPSDASELTVRTDQGRIRVEHQLFTEHLEKGVIRRGRAQAVWLPSTAVEASARSLYHEFCQEEPPLTT